MSNTIFNNIFSKEELTIFNNFISDIVIPKHEDGTYIYDTDNSSDLCVISKSLGRLQTSGLSKNLPDSIYKKLNHIVSSVSKKDLGVSSITYVEYNKKYGTPELPPHFDGDSSDLIVNFQLESNIEWPIGLGLKVYNLKDNSALVFDPNKGIHWRTKKIFKDEEYVKMIFFRFKNLKNTIDNSHLRYSLDHEVYKEVNKFRDSL